MHAFGGNEHPRRLLELAVRGERHPESVEIVGAAFGIEGHGGFSFCGKTRRYQTAAAGQAAPGSECAALPAPAHLKLIFLEKSARQILLEGFVAHRSPALTHGALPKNPLHPGSQPFRQAQQTIRIGSFEQMTTAWSPHSIM
ncbi:MAG: hypothetical protein JKP98_24270 [Rhodobacteraceae bacterium]|nr:hypothetical protein [Paracoccaceae bacterium]